MSPRFLHYELFTIIVMCVALTESAHGYDSCQTLCFEAQAESGWSAIWSLLPVLVPMLAILAVILMFIFQNRRDARLTLLDQICTQRLDRFHTQMDEIRREILDICKTHEPDDPEKVEKIKNILDQEYSFLNEQMRSALGLINKIKLLSERNWYKQSKEDLDAVYVCFGELAPLVKPLFVDRKPQYVLIGEVNSSISVLRHNLFKAISTTHISIYKLCFVKFG